MNDLTGDELTNVLCNALNEQGYLFQEACVNVLKKSDSEWEVEFEEYPVAFREQDTKIDIILRWKRYDEPYIYAILECKRADPSYRCWLFGASGELLYANHCTVFTYQHGKPRVMNLNVINQIYHVPSWMEVKRPIDKRRLSSPQNIEDSFGQVLRGLAGFANEQFKLRIRVESKPRLIFIPIVVTTATLYVANYASDNIEISTGQISKEKISFGELQGPPEQIDWVIADYGAGPNVLPDESGAQMDTTNPKELQWFKQRSIFIVNSCHLDSFSNTFSFNFE